MWKTLTDAIKSMYDSLVRTYSPMLIGALIGWAATWLPIIPPEIENGLVILIGLLAQFIWYFIVRLIEVTKNGSSKLITLGLTRAEPVYGEIVAETPASSLVLVDTEPVEVAPDK